MAEFDIRTGHLDHPQIIALLETHMRGMLDSSPVDATHFLDLSALRASNVTFLSCWEGGTLLGIGALKQLDNETGEIKSMRTAEAALSRSVGASILRHIVAIARDRGYAALKLETGTGPAFDAAHALYARHGFGPCPPFADYKATDFNRFFALSLIA